MTNPHPHSKIEKSLFLLITLTIIVSLIGALFEILPFFKKEVAIEEVQGMRPYTPLELIGFNIYKREGCYNCHSQQIRYLRDEVERYGHYSLAAESMYDHPFQWGSKRTGPDLARIGEKYSDDWHAQHMYHPQSVVPESIMPSYKALFKNIILDLDITNLDKINNHTQKNTKIRERLMQNDIEQNMKILQTMGVPYSNQDIINYKEDILIQLGIIQNEDKVKDFNIRYPNAKIRKFNKQDDNIKEIDALIAYLQSLGQKIDLKTNMGRNW